MRIRDAVEDDAGFIIEIARLASVIEDRPMPVHDDPEVRGMLPAAGDCQ